MAKRRKTYDDFEHVAYCLTLLLAAISPGIDKSETYNLMYEMIDQGIDEQNAKTYGALVRASVFENSKAVH